MRDKAENLARAGRFAEADKIYQAQLAKTPRNTPLLQSYIRFHNRHTARYRRAVPAVRTLLEVKPKSATTQALAAETFANCNRLPAARRYADQALALGPDDADVLFIAAHVALREFDPPRALALVDRALAQTPDHRPAKLQRARALFELGQMAAARALCRAVLKDAPEDINFISLYVSATPMTRDDPILAHMQNVMLPAFQKIGGPSLASLLKLIGKACNDLGDYDAAFAHFAQSKKALPMVYDAKGYARYVAMLCTQVSRADYFGRGIEDDRPVLIVGMPRSGSTLIAQILAAHPQVTSIGESPSLNVIVQDLPVRTHHGGDMVKAIKQMPPKASRALAQRYLAETARGDARHVIDKSLHNFELLGVFAAMLPKARIIHVRRDPMDTCVSCYMQRLSAWHKYTQSLESLGHAYLQYDKLMQHWKTALPNPICEVRYEDTLADLEGVARRLIGFLGLDWDPACLAFQNADNQVQTLSAQQVRQPLYTSSVQRWRRYAPHLAPLQKALAPLYPNGFD